MTTPGCKAVIALTRAADMSHAEFASWWLERHAPLAAQLPGLRRAVFNLVEDPIDGDPDGISELWFESREAFDSAYASEIGARVVADSMSNVSSRRRTFVTEHVIIDDG